MEESDFDWPVEKSYTQRNGNKLAFRYFHKAKYELECQATVTSKPNKLKMPSAYVKYIK